MFVSLRVYLKLHIFILNSLVRRYPLHPNQYHQFHLFLKSHHQQQPWLQPTEKIRCLDDTIAWMSYNRMSFIVNNINHDNLNAMTTWVLGWAGAR